MILQLDPALPLDTPKGKGWAHLVIDYGIESPLFFVTFLDDNGECWIYRNEEVRFQKNLSLGRKNISEIKSNSTT